MNHKYFELLTNTFQPEDTVMIPWWEESYLRTWSIPWPCSIKESHHKMREMSKAKKHPESPNFMFCSPTPWLQDFSHNAMKTGLDYCSPYLISFHQFTKLKWLEKILYQQCPRWPRRLSVASILDLACGGQTHLVEAVNLMVCSAL
jgi:hypothetical protein